MEPTWQYWVKKNSQRLLRMFPCEFHVNRDAKTDTHRPFFAELEFKVPGSTFFETSSTCLLPGTPAQPASVQNRFVWNIIETPAPGIKIKQENNIAQPETLGQTGAVAGKKYLVKHAYVHERVKETKGSPNWYPSLKAYRDLFWYRNNRHRSQRRRRQ